MKNVILKNKSKGFTLVELLVVIAIIGLLASVIIVSVNSARAKARDSRRLSDMKAAQTAVELWKDGNNGNAPAGPTATFWDSLTNAGYLPSDPADPQTKTVYPAYNSGTDETYAVEFETETQTQLGPAGVYCATSLSIVPAGGADCTGSEN